MRKIQILAVFISLIALVSVASAFGIPFTVIAKATYPGTVTSAYVDVRIMSGGNSALPDTGSVYPGYCLEPDTVLANGQIRNYSVYSTLGVIMPIVGPGNWNAINWILDNSPYDAHVNQSAIWQLDGGRGHYWEPVNKTQVSLLITAATAQPGYTPAIGQPLVYILFNSTHYQPLVIVYHYTWKWAPVPPVPEFPSVVLPVTMILGFCGVIFLIGRRRV